MMAVVVVVVVGSMAGETIEEITGEHLLLTNHTLPELELVVQPEEDLTEECSSSSPNLLKCNNSDRSASKPPSTWV